MRTYLRLRRIHGQVQYPQKPEEVTGAGMQTDAPIRKHREQQRTYKQVRQRTDRVREDVRTRAVQPVHALPHEDLPLFEERRDTCDGHEPQERDGVEVHRESIILDQGGEDPGWQIHNSRPVPKNLPLWLRSGRG